MVVVDAGDSLGPLRVGEGDGLAQAREKADLVAWSLSTGGLDAMTLGPADWALGRDTVQALAAEHDLPVLAANLTCDGEAPFPAHRVVERAGRRIALVGVTQGEVPGCRIERPAVALKRAVDALPPHDLTVALLPLQIRQVELLAGALEGVDLVFHADPTVRREAPPRVGGAWPLGSGRRGQHVGVTTLHWTEGAEGWVPADLASARAEDRERLQSRIDALSRRLEGDLPVNQRRPLEGSLQRSRKELASVDADLAWGQAPRHRFEVTWQELSDAVPDAAAVEARVQAVKKRIEDGVVGAGAPPPDAPRVASDTSPFAGSKACAACHAAEHADWSASPHARAWAGLVAAGASADHTCFGCHATGVGTEGGPTMPAEVGGLRDVQCEACHGPARAHAGAPGDHPLEGSVDAGVCTACHDGERDRGRFSLPEYMPRVDHDPATKAPEPPE